MTRRRVSISKGAMFATIAALAAFTTHAADGLVAPRADTLWPQWQVRISVLTPTPSMLTTPGADRGSAAKGLQGGALLGDYYFNNTASLGGFRASGGLLTGGLGGQSLVGTGSPAYPPGADSPVTVPYLGLGFTGAAWRTGLAVTADFGLIAERATAAVGLGRAVFGNEGVDRSLREMRLSPVMQLGMRYTFW